MIKFTAQALYTRIIGQIVQTFKNELMVQLIGLLNYLFVITTFRWHCNDSTEHKHQVFLETVYDNAL